MTHLQQLKWLTYGADNQSEWLGVDVTITHCSDGSYCCGTGDTADSCCNAHGGFRIQDGRNVVVAYSSQEQTSSPTVATSGLSETQDASRPSTTATSPTSGSRTNSTAIIVGSAVGGGCGLLFLVAAIYLLLRRHRQRIESKLDAALGTKTKIISKPVPHWELSGDARDESLNNPSPVSHEHELSAETATELYGTGPCADPTELK